MAELSSYMDGLRAREDLNEDEAVELAEWDSYSPPEDRLDVLANLTDEEQMRLLDHLYNKFLGVTYKRVAMGRMVSRLKYELGYAKIEAVILANQLKTLTAKVVYQNMSKAEKDEIRREAVCAKYREEIERLNERVRKFKHEAELWAVKANKLEMEKLEELFNV
jgi:hypothetical protein